MAFFPAAASVVDIAGAGVGAGAGAGGDAGGAGAFEGCMLGIGVLCARGTQTSSLLSLAPRVVDGVCQVVIEAARLGSDRNTSRRFRGLLQAAQLILGALDEVWKFGVVVGRYGEPTGRACVGCVQP